VAEQEQNRSEEATPFKLEEAKKRGSIAKSQELNSFIILLWAGIAIATLGKGVVHKTLAEAKSLFDRAGSFNFDEARVAVWVPQIFADVLWILLPLLLGTVVVGALIHFLQSGPIFTFFPLKPDLERINPLAGFKRVFSLRLIVESIKTLIKIGLLGTTLYFFIVDLLPSSTHLSQFEARQFIPFLLSKSGALILKLCAALALIVCIDIGYTHWDFKNRMRMSRREVKEEYKRREGDPRIRQKIRDLQRESAKRRGAAQKVKDADVLITNPQRLAIALKYRRGEMDAPKVLAKGAGDLAAQMRMLARRYGVPIIENKPLARAMFRETGIDQTIRDKHFPIVAKILVWAFALRRAETPDTRPSTITTSDGGPLA